LERSNATMKIYLWSTRALAVICLFALLLSHLALIDIAHGEPDVSSEWLIVQITAGLLVVFIVMVLGLLRKYARQYKN